MITLTLRPTDKPGRYAAMIGDEVLCRRAVPSGTEL